MSSEPSTSVTDRARLNLKSDSSATGSFDGAWWPASRDFAAELPAITAEMSTRLGPVERVAFNLDAWPGAPRKIKVGDATVRMAGFHSIDFDTVQLIGARRRVTLKVVPPETDETAAASALEAAGSTNPNGTTP